MIMPKPKRKSDNPNKTHFDNVLPLRLNRRKQATLGRMDDYLDD